MSLKSGAKTRKYGKCPFCGKNVPYEGELLEQDGDWVIVFDGTCPACGKKCDDIRPHLYWP